MEQQQKLSKEDTSVATWHFVGAESEKKAKTTEEKAEKIKHFTFKDRKIKNRLASSARAEGGGEATKSAGAGGHGVLQQESYRGKEASRCGDTEIPGHGDQDRHAVIQQDRHVVTTHNFNRQTKIIRERLLVVFFL